MKTLFIHLLILSLIISCTIDHKTPETEIMSIKTYFDQTGRDDQLSGGIKMIPITTPSGTYKVWTKRIGNNPRIKLLLLHGGPGGTHEAFECFDGYLPQEGIEYYYYDQLGSYYSDQPTDTSLWDMGRFADEVEQVRQALGLDSTNFYILGQSGGGILAIEYALKYQQHLKGMIISNMMASVPEYNRYAQEVLGPQMEPDILQEIKQLEANNDFQNPQYSELLTQHYYTQHILRMPPADWPEPVNRAFKHMNMQIYVYMQGYSEFGISGNATLKNWDRTADLLKIKVPTLTIGGQYDTMDPKHMEWMSTQVQRGRYLHCPNGSHLAMYDDQKTYFAGLIRFMKEVDNESF